jgi:ApeA N-terminal domain 1
LIVEIDDLEGRQQFGEVILPNGETARAQFVLDGRETSIQIIDPSNGLGFSSIPEIKVTLVDGQKLTFLKNIRTSAVHHHGGGGAVVTYMPHFVIVGRSFPPAHVEFEEVAFTISDANAIFYDFDAFSIDLAADRSRITDIVEERFKRIGRRTEVGDSPIIAYFTGKFEIFSVQVGSLKVSANHQPSYGMGGPGGIALSNWIKVSLEFDPYIDLGGAITKLIALLRFFQIIAGRKQEVLKLRVRLRSAKEHEWHALYWCLAWSAKCPEKGPHPSDIPINGGTDPSGFGNVLAEWLKSDGAAIDARVRFSSAFGQGEAFGPDRLVAAANIFDLLPSDRFLPPPPLSDAEKTAQANAIELFQALPPSDIRERGLGDLGRLGVHNLKSRVLQRAAIVTRLPDGRFRDLGIVLRDAVDARNHFVHGTTASKAKAEMFRKSISLYTLALETTFALSELLDCGWDWKAWQTQPKGQSHPFADFFVNFELELSAYRKKKSGSVG